MTTRRQFSISLAASACWPLTGRAQPLADRIRKIGFLAVRSRVSAGKPDADYVAFTQAMSDLGYVEGKNLVIEWRFAHGKYDAFPALAAQLVQMPVEVIVTEGTPATRAAQQVTKTIPIVTTTVGDPVQSGFAVSLGRPGGNITGLSSISVDLGPKQIEFLKTMAPKAARIAVLINPDAPHHTALVRNLEVAAKTVGAALLLVDARDEAGIERAFASLPRLRAQALLIASDAFFSGQLATLAALAAKQRLPSIYTLPGFVEAGGLMSYGQDLVQYFRYAATFVNKILKGTRPSELPFEQPTKFEMAINLKTAKALGLKVPQAIMIQATKVIE